MSELPVKRRRLDSDDDDGEYAQPHRSSPLLQYAVTAALPTDELPLMGYLDEELAVEDRTRVQAVGGNSSTEKEIFEARGATIVTGDAAAAAAEAELHTSTDATAPTPSTAPAIFDEDEDVPAEYKGLFSTELLNVLLVPLDSICKQKTMTDKLLTQYLPPAPARVGTQLTSNVKSYHNVYGIAPGFRWDGVVRGRGPVN